MNLNIQNTGKEKSNLSSAKKVKLLINVLKKRYRLNNRTKDPYRVLISTLLSQRTRDETTERVSSRLFSNCRGGSRTAPTLNNFKSLSEEEIASLIKPVGFYKVKARRIKEISSILIEKWDSKVPSTLEELLSLPGIGRKTANCVLAYGFGIPALPVDTHVHRISNRLGLVNTRTPYETEDALTQIVPQEYWGWLNKALVEFGKEICRPVKPKCKECELNPLCLHYFLYTLPEHFRETIIETHRRLLKKFSDIYAIVLVGSVAEDAYEMDSDVDILYAKKEKASIEDVMDIKKGLGKVQFITYSEESLSYHFEHSTTMAWSIKRGRVLYERNNFLEKYLSNPLGMPSREWRRKWFDYWCNIFEYGTYDSLYRAVVNFTILFLETQGIVPTTKKQIASSFKKIVNDKKVLEGVSIALDTHHKNRFLTDKEKPKLLYATKWLKSKLNFNES